MTPSTTRDNKKSRFIKLALAAFFWLALWQIVSDYIGQEMLLVSPVSVLTTLFALATESSFWAAIWGSFSRIVSGFLLALLAGILLSALAHALPPVQVLLAPLVVVIKSIPVASFVILLLIWIGSKNLAIPIAFLMVFPITYLNLLEGIKQTDRRLLEMAQVFEVPLSRRVLYIYLSNVLPFFASACRVGLGLCWKAGVAAEVIGIPQNSIGERLYRSKLYLDTAELFAWTLVVVLLSVGFEKLFTYLVARLVRYTRER